MSNSYAEGFSLYTATGDRKYLNHSERQRALATMTALEPSQALFALTLAWTGARISEVLALNPTSFQIEGSIVALHTLKRRRPVVREVPIPPWLMTELNRCFGLSARQSDPLTNKLRLWRWCRVTGWRIIKRVMHRSGIEGGQACPRGFRHAFGVGALQGGVPITLLQRWLGHARLSTTSIYADVMGPEELAFAAQYWRWSDGHGEPPIPRGMITARRAH